LIENVAVLLYLSDTRISSVESQCRKLLIDLHDYKSRRDFLRLLGKPEAPGDDKIMPDLQARLRNNEYFQSLSAKKQKRLAATFPTYCQLAGQVFSYSIDPTPPLVQQADQLTRDCRPPVADAPRA
jgi:hypothetical protein